MTIVYNYYTFCENLEEFKGSEYKQMDGNANYTDLIITNYIYYQMTTLYCINMYKYCIVKKRKAASKYIAMPNYLYHHYA